jgi:hypothetical protein
MNQIDHTLSMNTPDDPLVDDDGIRDPEDPAFEDEDEDEELDEDDDDDDAEALKDRVEQDIAVQGARDEGRE